MIKKQLHFKILLAILSMFITQASFAQCTYQLKMIDSFGDGWNGNQIDIQVGTSNTIYTLVNGFDSTINLTLNTGDSIILNYLGGGSFNNEVSFELYDATLSTIYTSGSGPSTGIAFADTATCPSCLIPSLLNNSNITVNSAELNWTENNSATSWIVQYGLSGFPIGSGIDSLVTSRPFTLSGLNSSTTYDWYVRSICAVGDTSAWSSINSFTTQLQCPIGAVCVTYTAGKIFSDRNFTSLPGSSTCPGSMTLVIPAGNRIDSISTSYSIEAGNGGWMSEQLSRLYSPNTIQGESSLAAGTGNTAGVFSYFRDGLTFANGAIDTVTIQLENGRTFGGSACDSLYNDVVNGSWEVIAYYSSIPACVEPIGLSTNNISSDSAQLNWNEVGTASSWEISYDTSGFTAGNGTQFITSADSLNINGLSANTNYDWYVRSICAIGDTSAWSLVSSFKTLIQGAQGFTCLTGNTSIVFSEEFDAQGSWTGTWGTGATGDTWNIRTGTTGSTNTGPSGAHSGLNYVFFETSGSSSTPISIVSPPIDLTQGSDFAELSFWLHAYGATIGTLNVGIGTSASGPFTTEFSWSGELQTAEIDPWQNVGVNLDSYVGQTIYIQLAYTRGSSFTGDLAIDLMEVSTCLSCVNPSNITFTNIETDETTVNWTQGGLALNWEIEYVLAGAAQGSGTLINVSTNPTTLSSLTSGTSFDVYIRAICGVGDTSGWVGPTTFNTSEAVPFFEDFETFNPGITSNPWPKGWSSSTSSNPRWESEDASGVNENSTGTGPFFDNTTPSTSGGMYIFLETSGGGLNDSADFISPPIFIDSSQSAVELSFWYHMHGADMGNLEVLVDTNGIQTQVAFISGQQQVNQGDSWLQAKTFLNGYQGKSIQLVFRGFRGNGFTSDMSIDDVQIEPLLSNNAGVIDITSPSLPLCPGNITPVVVVENKGTDTLNNVQVFWDVNGVIDSTLFTGTINPGTTANVSLGTVTILASTTYNIKFYTKNPNGLADMLVSDDTLSLLNLSTGLVGNFTINSGQLTGGTNFASFTDFATAVSTLGVCGNIDVDVVANSGPYNEQFLLQNIVGTSASSRITINGNNDTLSFVTSSNERRIVGLSNVSFITLKNLNIVSAGPTFGYGIQMDMGSHDILIDSCNIDISAVTSTSSVNSVGILSSGSLTSPATTGNNASRITISNSRINGGISEGMYYGIRFNGLSTTISDTSIRIVNNEISNFYAYGIYLNHISNSLIEGNDIHRADKQTVTTFYGIYTTGGSSADTANANRIHNSHGSATSLTGASYPIYNSSNDADPTNPNIFVNNLIYDINSNGTIYGIYNSGSDNQAYVNNTISLDHAAATGGITRGIYQTTTAIGITFANNNISITRGGTGVKHGIYLNTNTSVVNSNFNNVYLNSTGSGSQFLGRENATDHLDINAWQVASSLDTNSIDSDPLYVDLINGDLTPTNPDLDGAGSNLGVFVDFFGVIRNNPPDIGAIEFIPPVMIPYYPIGTINTEDNNGVADSLNVVCQTSGTVVGTDRRGNGYELTLIDLSSSSQEGIVVFRTTNLPNYANPTEGDSLLIYGTVSQFNGLTQFEPDSIFVISTGATIPSPIPTSTLDENTESKLLSIQNFVLLDASGTNSYNMRAFNGTDTLLIRVDADTDVNDSLNIPGQELSVGDTICAMIGVGGQFDNSTPFLDGYQIFPSRFADITICRLVPPTVIPFYPIRTINTEDANGVADSLNVVCQTSGTVVGTDRRGNGYEFTLIDISSSSQEGIVVFRSGNLPNYTNPTEGDSLLIYGTVSQFNGLTQFVPDSIFILSSGATVPSPIPTTVLDESTESKLLSIQNFILLDSSLTNSYNMLAYNGTDTLTIRVDADTDVNDSLNLPGVALKVGDTICALIGVGGQFDNSSPFLDGYQIFPSRFTDITICRLSPVGINDAILEDQQFSIYPNPTSGDFTIASSGFNEAAVRLIIRDISGRIITVETILNANSSLRKSFNLNDKAKGIYFISIIDGNQVINQKLTLH